MRREYIAFLRMKRQAAWQELQDQLMAVLQIQSGKASFWLDIMNSNDFFFIFQSASSCAVIRGWMVRRHISNMQDLKQSSVSIEPPERKSSEVKVFFL